ncbi:lysozyme inhibitor LprI family protein [Gluconobacter thailandicus]|uniref:lysozyme inhibitor LprI family protein n=1 Tax=Gluconobacter thailandicus TaxID=257438 RepID=UPI001CD36E5C|nr:lysozyme inhibitor LprI family protein [Gluconobacter thailandicus]
MERSRKTQLQKAQQAWLHYRDKTCDAEHNLFKGGTAGLAALPACREALTRHRISDLRDGYWWLVEKFGARQGAPLQTHGDVSP